MRGRYRLLPVASVIALAGCGASVEERVQEALEDEGELAYTVERCISKGDDLLGKNYRCVFRDDKNGLTFEANVMDFDGAINLLDFYTTLLSGEH